MERGVPSRTAQGAAMHRAAHQLLDDPPVFADPLALRIIGAEAAQELRDGTARQALAESIGMRAFLVARSRFTEDSFAAAVEKGVRNYVLLGAGLDTFAYRAAARFPGIRVYEIDHPTTQAWKRARLAEAGIAIPDFVTYAPVDFEHETLADGFKRAGFDFAEPAFFAWLGVVPYLTREAVMGTLNFVAQSAAKGSEIVFDYPVPPNGIDTERRAAFEARVAAMGEPLLSSFDPAALAQDVRAMGFSHIDDLELTALNARYFDGRSDGLKLRGFAHILKARV
jgi:methyltransferase (TIGR00027 family)